jgi:hypothetical protein
LMIAEIAIVIFNSLPEQQKRCRKECDNGKRQASENRI